MVPADNNASCIVALLECQMLCAARCTVSHSNCIRTPPWIGKADTAPPSLLLAGAGYQKSLMASIDAEKTLLQAAIETCSAAVAAAQQKLNEAAAAVCDSLEALDSAPDTATEAERQQLGQKQQEALASKRQASIP
jgi:hypothetical protein